MTEKSEAEKLFWEEKHLEGGIQQAKTRINKIRQRLQEIAIAESKETKDAEDEQEHPVVQ